MGILKSMFTWWDGPTWGTRFASRFGGNSVGNDTDGNRYYQSNDGKRRWVIYNGINDASRVPPEWHGWLHKTTDVLPADAPIAPKPWQQPHVPNMTGTPRAWVRPGALGSDKPRAAATGDYEAWSPDDAAPRAR